MSSARSDSWQSERDQFVRKRLSIETRIAKLDAERKDLEIESGRLRRAILCLEKENR